MTPPPQRGFPGALCSRIRGEFAEFLQYYSSIRLSILCAPTSVGLRYSRVLRCGGFFSGSSLGPLCARWGGFRWWRRYGVAAVHHHSGAYSARHFYSPAFPPTVLPSGIPPHRLVPPPILNATTLFFGHGTRSPSSSDRPSSALAEPRLADSDDLPAQSLASIGASLGLYGGGSRSPTPRSLAGYTLVPSVGAIGPSP